MTAQGQTLEASPITTTPMTTAEGRYKPKRRFAGASRDRAECRVDVSIPSCLRELTTAAACSRTVVAGAQYGSTSLTTSITPLHENWHTLNHVKITSGSHKLQGRPHG